MKTMVLMNDPFGAPRAWGAAQTEDEAREEAKRQLEIYCAKKREVGDLDLADPSKFTEEVELVREIEPGALVQLTTRSGFRFGVVVGRGAGANAWEVCGWMDNSRRWTLPQRMLEGNLEPVIPERLKGFQRTAVARARATFVDGWVKHPGGKTRVPVLP